MEEGIQVSVDLEAKRAQVPQTSDAASVLLSLIRRLLAELRGGDRPRVVELKSRLEEDLGIDSLTRVELGLRIERAFEVRLPENLVMEARTPDDLLRGITLGLGPHRVAVDRLRAVPLDEAPVEGEPADARTLLDMLAWHAERHPDRLHVTFLASDDETQTLTYGELDRRARRAAAVLQRLGLRPQAACAIMLPSSLEFFVAYYGALIAGAIPVPIYPPFRMSQLEDHLRRQAGILANCEASVLITVAEAKLLARLVKGQAPALAHVVTPSELEAQGEPAMPLPLGPQDIAFLQYTSGSTGNPKGVILTHANLLANIRAMGHACGAGPHDTFVSWLPLYHDMGLIGAWLSSLYFGLKLVLMSPVSFLSRPVRWLQAIHRYGGTISAAPNFAFELCASRLEEKDVAGIDLSTWRWAFNGAEAVSADTLTRFANRFAAHGFDPLTLAPVYGLAECALDLAFPPARRGARVEYIDRDMLLHAARARTVSAEHPHAQKSVACGQALPGYAIRIVDEKSHIVPDRVQGRIQFQGPSATPGYYRNPAATAELFDTEWLNTGDLGYLAEGELYVTGRAKDMIIRGGHNIHPQELEEAVGDLPGIRKGCVAVFGARDTVHATERLVVLAETRESDTEKRERLRDEITQLSIALTGGPPDDVVLAPPHAVLKTSSGKLRRAATRDAYEHGLIGKGSRAVWWQVTRLALRGLALRARYVVTRALQALYSVWAWAAFGVAAFVGFVLTFLAPSIGARWAVARWLARALARAAGLRCDVHGLQHLPDNRRYTLVANHASYLDALLLIATLPHDVAFVAKAEFKRSWVMRRLLEAIGTRFVERFDMTKGAEDARELSQLARGGQPLAFFPEGTFVREPGLLPFRMGAFVVSAANNLPVVPVSIVGTRALLPAGTWILKPGTVRVVIDAPIAPTGTDWDAALKQRDAARAAILGNCGEPDRAL